MIWYLFYKQAVDIVFESKFIYRILRELNGLHIFIEPLTVNRTRSYRNFYVLDTEPIIILTMETTGDLALFSEIVGEQTVYFLKLFPWTREVFFEMYREARYYRKHQEKHPKHKIIFLCNTEKEMKLARNFGISAIWCNHNCFLNEKLYYPQEKAKQYDVIYNARLDPIKRHYLLAKIDRVGLILGPNVNDSPVIRTYKQVVKSVLSHAVITNERSLILGDADVDLDFPLLSPQEVTSVLNKSKVGAILSREEGACYASAEYLLCGLPVITTPNTGGRDVLFDKEYVRCVPPVASAIKTAVAELTNLNFDSTRIRNSTIKKMELHRKRFRNLLQGIYDKERPGYNVNENWGNIFINKMMLFGQKWPEDFLIALGNKQLEQ